MADQLDRIELKVDANCEKLDIIEKTLVGDMESNGKIGLLERIRRIEKWIDKREYWEKVIITAVIMNLLGLIFLFIQNALAH